MASHNRHQELFLGMFPVTLSLLVTLTYLYAILYFVIPPVENTELCSKLQGEIIFEVRLEPCIAKFFQSLV